MKSTKTFYRMKLTDYELRTLVGILNTRRLQMKEQGHTLNNSQEYNDLFNLLEGLVKFLPA